MNKLMDNEDDFKTIKNSNYEVNMSSLNPKSKENERHSTSVNDLIGIVGKLTNTVKDSNIRDIIRKENLKSEQINMTNKNNELNNNIDNKFSIKKLKEIRSIENEYKKGFFYVYDEEQKPYIDDTSLSINFRKLSLIQNMDKYDKHDNHHRQNYGSMKHSYRNDDDSKHEESLIKNLYANLSAESRKILIYKNNDKSLKKKLEAMIDFKFEEYYKNKCPITNKIILALNSRIIDLPDLLDPMKYKEEPSMNTNSDEIDELVDEHQDDKDLLKNRINASNLILETLSSGKKKTDSQNTNSDPRNFEHTKNQFSKFDDETKSNVNSNKKKVNFNEIDDQPFSPIKDKFNKNSNIKIHNRALEQRNSNVLNHNSKFSDKHNSPKPHIKQHTSPTFSNKDFNEELKFGTKSNRGRQISPNKSLGSSLDSKSSSNSSVKSNVDSKNIADHNISKNSNNTADNNINEALVFLKKFIDVYNLKTVQEKIKILSEVFRKNVFMAKKINLNVKTKEMILSMLNDQLHTRKNKDIEQDQEEIKATNITNITNITIVTKPSSEISNPDQTQQQNILIKEDYYNDEVYETHHSNITNKNKPQINRTPNVKTKTPEKHKLYIPTGVRVAGQPKNLVALINNNKQQTPNNINNNLKTNSKIISGNFSNSKYISPYGVTNIVKKDNQKIIKYGNASKNTIMRSQKKSIIFTPNKGEKNIWLGKLDSFDESDEEWINT